MTLLASIFSINDCIGQVVTPVRDPGLLGQYKRMVFKQWNDWQPDPTTTGPGWPKNPEGWFFWRVLNRKYHKGKDLRHMKPEGVFYQHYGAAVAQGVKDENTKDTAYVTMRQSIATDLNMTGGDADLPWDIYFKKKFEGLFKKVSDAFAYVQFHYPGQYTKMMQENNTEQMITYFDITKDRIQTIHHSFVDRGERMNDYFSILKELEPEVDLALAYCRVNIRHASVPEPKQILSMDTAAVSIHDKDADIVKEILMKWRQ